jgi:serine/threonine protein kinase
MAEKWQIGDRIGGFYEIREIHGGEGKSGMGVVYICYYPWHQKLYALKTYQDRFALSEKLMGSFYREAMLWMVIENHPNIVQAHWVHDLDGRIYIVMEYIPTDNRGRRTLTSHLNGPLLLLRVLIYAIQFCYGMEYAYSKGIKVHRDIKPDNILITLDKTLKITDFGLSKAFNEEMSPRGEVAGTPYWMSPEQFDDAGNVDIRSDVYSFGVVLYQMVSGDLPFKASATSKTDFLEEMYRLHRSAAIPKINSTVFRIVEKCMAKEPTNRYKDFTELRHELEILWEDSTDIPLPKQLIQMPFGYKEINQKGVALKHLGKPSEAIEYHNKATEENPIFQNAWNDKGVALWELKRHKEALECFDKAIEIDHEFVHPRTNKAALLSELGCDKEAIECYDEALKIEPEFINLWRGKGNTYLKLRNYKDAIQCYDQVLKINRRDSGAWYIKGVAYYSIGRNYVSKAMECAKMALDINPFLYVAHELIDKCQNYKKAKEGQ